MENLQFFEIRISSSEKEWTINLPFVCEKCGNCCTMFGYLNGVCLGDLTEDEKNELKLVLEEIKEKDDFERSKMRCLFLNESNLCRIYNRRPFGCKEYPFGGKKEMCSKWKELDNIITELVKGYRCWTSTDRITKWCQPQPSLTEIEVNGFLDKFASLKKITDVEKKLFIKINQKTC